MGKFQIVVLTDHDRLLYWHYNVLNNIITKIPSTLIIVTGRNPNKNKGISSDPLFLRLQKKFERGVFSKKITFDREMDIAYFISHIGFSDPSVCIRQMNLEDIDKLSTEDIDIVLDFRDHLSENNPYPGSRYGVLKYGPLSTWKSPDTPECYWETVNRLSEIEVGLILKDNDLNTERVIFRTGLIPYPNSVVVNINNACELASVLIPWIISGIFSGGTCFIDNLQSNHGIYSLSQKIALSGRPSPFVVIMKFFKVSISYLFNRLGRPKIKRWFLLIRKKQSNINTSFFIGSNTELVAGKEKLWADPFIVTINPFHYIFIEEYIYKIKKAHISVLTLDRDFRILDNRKILEKSYHLSYPHIILNEGKYYMIPETGSNRTIQLYRCTGFPDKWDFVMNLVEGIEARDTTIFFYAEKWWMFTSVVLYKNETFDFSGLFLYYSDELICNRWINHPQNPITCDHKFLRPAGNIFISDGNIFRPSQDCSGEYGSAININRVTVLSETEYKEEFLSKIEPPQNSNFSGAHTYNFSQEIEVIDVFQ